MKKTNRFFLIAGSLLLSLSTMGNALAMQSAPQPPSAPSAAAALAQVSVTEDAEGVHISWAGEVQKDENGYPAAQGWTQQTLGNARLPIYPLALRMPEGAAAKARVDVVRAAAWDGEIERAPVIRPENTNEEAEVDLNPPEAMGEIETPNAPWLITGDSHLRGVRIVGMAFTPIYQKGGQVQAASQLKLTIPGARLLRPEDTRWNTDAPGGGPSAPLATDTITTPPINPAALTTSVRITVTNAGIQRITGQALSNAGFNIASLTLANAHVFYRGAEIAAQVVDGNANGAMDATDEIRFYAKKPGDQWNRTEIYWVTFDTTPGLRMMSRDVTPTGANPIQQNALEEGEWRVVTNYQPRYGGIDGDHFFGPLMYANYISETRKFTATYAFTPTFMLPMATGPVTVTAFGIVIGSYNPQGYTWTLQNPVSGGSATAWSPVSGNVSPTFVLAGNAPFFRLSLSPPGSVGANSSYIDSISLTRPVALNFSASGAAFKGFGGINEYVLSNTPTDSWLYDISSIQSPILLKHITASSASFRDDGAANGKRYLLSGAGTAFEPVLTKYSPQGLDQALNAIAIYIGPASFAPAVQPLLALRQSQGVSAVFVDIQKIYDGWSYGRVSPLAIRDFLRYAVKQWATAPTSVVLMGDTTFDPLNYIKSAVNIVPAYLLPTDPFPLETSGAAPCDSCLANLDGDSPVPPGASYTSDYLPDLDIGRFPVQNAEELTTLVSKIVGYETQVITADATWNNRAAYMSDNYVCNPGSYSDCVAGSGSYAGYTVDAAGNFYSSTQAAMALQPADVTTECNMYMPPEGPASNDPCYSRSDSEARQRALNMYREGSLVSLYSGHGSYQSTALLGGSSSFMINVTVTAGIAQSQNDVLSMDNGLKLPVVLEMACYTSKYQESTPVNKDHALDEQLLLSGKGGAIATWGSTGESIATGHDALTHGFLASLWSSTYQPTLGELTRASRLDAYANKPCCRDVMYSFTLLGDPLTRIRKNVANVEHKLYLPLISK
ncbi:MAG TPA: C25 family cysteine peptidase [Thermoflexales bacterium]|nr:C25 family cysteine peptidase [Thermoflexales bacterium]